MYLDPIRPTFLGILMKNFLIQVLKQVGSSGSSYQSLRECGFGCGVWGFDSRASGTRLSQGLGFRFIEFRTLGFRA